MRLSQQQRTQIVEAARTTGIEGSVQVAGGEWVLVGRDSDQPKMWAARVVHDITDGKVWWQGGISYAKTKKGAIKEALSG